MLGLNLGGNYDNRNSAIPSLCDPDAQGMSDAPAFHIVCPTLPGYSKQQSTRPQTLG